MSDGSLSREFEDRICEASAVVLMTRNANGIEAEIMHNQERGDLSPDELARALRTLAARVEDRGAGLVTARLDVR